MPRRRSGTGPSISRRSSRRSSGRGAGCPGTRSSRATATGRRRRASCTESRCGSRRTSRAARRSRTRTSSSATRPATATAGSSRSGSAARRPTTRTRPFAPAFREARAAGLGSVPHAGEVVGPESVRTALDHLEPDRLRHGFRAIEDPALVEELAERGLVLDITPISNLRTGAVPSLEEHPLPELVAAGVRCSVSTDDPVMFDTDLTREYEAAVALGLDPRQLYETALDGALCDDETRAAAHPRNSLGRRLGYSRDGTRSGEAPPTDAPPSRRPPSQGQRRPALRGHPVLQPAAQARQVGVHLPRRRLRRRVRALRRRLVERERPLRHLQRDPRRRLRPAVGEQGREGDPEEPEGRGRLEDARDGLRHERRHRLRDLGLDDLHDAAAEGRRRPPVAGDRLRAAVLDADPGGR